MTTRPSGTDTTPQQLRLLEAIIEHLPSMVFLKRADDLTFVLFNRAGEQLLGYTRADLLGKNDYDFFPKEQADFFTAKDRKVLNETGFKDIAEEPIDTRNNGRRVLHTKKIALYDEHGKPEYLLGISDDITERKQVEAALRHSEERYRAVITAMSEGIVIQQADGRIASCNAAAEAILGMNADQLRGLSASDGRWHPVREDGTPCPVDEHPSSIARNTGKSVNAVIMGVNHPGKGQRWVSVNAHPLRDPTTGNVEGCVASFIDITERRQHEALIDHTNQILTAVFDSSPALIAYLDPDMNFIRVNAAYARADEKAPDYFPGKNHFVLYPHAENEMIFRRVATTGIAYATKAKPFEYENNPERGVTHWDWSLTPIKDGAGTVTGLVLSLLNVTERIQALEQAQRHEQMLATMMNDMQGLVYRCKNDPDWTMVFMSGGCTALTGYEPADFLERRTLQYASLIHPDDQKKVWNDVQAALDKRQSFYLTYRVRTRDGTEKWVWERGHGVFGERGELQYLEGLIVDMTRQKQIEAELDHHRAHLEDLVRIRTAELESSKVAAERASRAKSEFLSRMSHELRTPMNAILGFSQVLELEMPPSLQLDSVREIHMAGDHLLALIDELLDLSRIEAGKMVTVLQSVPVYRAVDDTVRLMQPLLNHKKISLLNHCASDDTVLADPTRLQQILLNLISNAVKYNRDGGRVEVACVVVGKNRVRISVTDTGPGIPPDKLSSLFIPFERLGAEYSAIPGTGIGLALVKQLTELMGGAIGVESAPGRGSTFWVELPLGPTAAARDSASSATTTAVLPASSAHYNVLYVEDNAANLRVVEAIFRHYPHLHLISAVNGQHGLELARRYTPDVLLLDLHLPDISGFAVLKTLREDPGTRAIPALALSADALPLDIEKGLKAGFSDYLTKPIDVEKLMAALERVLGA